MLHSVELEVLQAAVVAARLAEIQFLVDLLVELLELRAAAAVLEFLLMGVMALGLHQGRVDWAAAAAVQQLQQP